MDNATKEKIDNLIDMAWKKRGIKDSISINEEALRLSEKYRYRLGIAHSKLCLGAWYVYWSEHGYEKCRDYLNSALEIFIEHNDIEGQIRTYHILSVFYGNQSRDDLSAAYLLKGYGLSKKSDNPLFGYITFNLSEIYYDMGNIEEAVRYLQECINFKYTEIRIISGALSGLGKCYMSLKDYSMAEQYAKQALDIGKDSDLPHDAQKEMTATAWQTLGSISSAKGEYEKAFRYLKLAITIFREIKDMNLELEKTMVLLDIGKVCIALGSIDEGISYLKEAICIGEKIEANRQVRDAHFELSSLYEKEIDFETALKHYKFYIEYSKIVNDAEIEKKISKYQTEMQLEAYKDIDAMSKIGRQLTASLDFNILLDQIYEHVKSFISAEVFGIGLYDANTGEIDYKLFMEKGKRIPMFTTTIDNPRSYAAKSIKERQTVVKNYLDTEEDNASSFVYEDFDEVRSIIYCPLIIADNIIGVITVQSYKLNAYQERELRLIETLASYIAIALNNSQKSEELKNTLHNLQEAQSQLIHSEKLAALGQLVSGIAHEINTPFGAIKTSADNVEMYMKSTIFEKLPKLLDSLSVEERELFFKMLFKSSGMNFAASSRAERQYKKTIALKLEEAGIETGRNLADILVKMGLYEEYEDFYKLLKLPESIDVFRTGYEMADMMKNCKNINIAVEKVSKLIYALRNYSHFDSSENAVKVRIADGIETVLELYYHNMKHSVEVIRDYRLQSEIMGYPDELSQVWTNIISNALQAMEYAGRLEIETYEEEGNAVVKITDSGSGIPDEIKSKIFIPFFTTKKQGEGTGLGLEIVKRIVDKHKGHIAVESLPGRTSFFVRLPIDGGHSLEALEEFR